MSALNSVIVDTEYGPVKGVKLSTDLGRDFFKFTVVPFMKAPLAKLRFRDAQAPDCWNQPLDTTGDRPSYTSFNFMDNSISGQENAGIVTVATPYLDRKLPVAVYIHGGGFQIA